MENTENFADLSFSGGSDSESTHSTPEDERIKRLFFTCDTNGDGFITYEDIMQVCIQLEMEYCVDEIMQQLGTDITGRISYADFVKRRSELLNQKSSKSETSEDFDSNISESKDPLIIPSSSVGSSCEIQSNPSSSLNDDQQYESHENRSSMVCSEESIKMWGHNNESESSSLGTTYTNSSVRHDSWEFDSGTHDLEIDTLSLHKQIEASGIEIPSNINELLNLANKYYIDSINTIKQEKTQIHNQLKTIGKEREFLQKQILSLKEEKICITKELEKKRLKERQQYEDKITELQCIVAELSQHLNHHKFLTIKEEDESDLKDKSINDESIELCFVSKPRTSHSNKSINSLDKSFKPIISPIEEDRHEDDWNSINKSKVFDMNINSLEIGATALEVDHLKCRITNLESQLDLSAIHLNESKENSERLTVLLGKYDANNTALQLALDYSEKGLAINELLVCLLESEIGLVLANCRAAGLGKLANMSEKEEEAEILRIYERATEKRKYAEESVLNYLFKNCSNFNQSDKKVEFNREHETKLKNLFQELKREKSVIKNSIVEIESFVINSDINKRIESKTSNIENIVLMQDFMAIKELNANLRSQLYSLKEKNSKLMHELKKYQDIYNEKSKIDETVSKNLFEEIKISEKIANNLKKENSQLTEQLEKAKKKYLMKINKLDHKIMSLQQKNIVHVKMLQNRISVLENDPSLRKSIETTL